MPNGRSVYCKHVAGFSGRNHGLRRAAFAVAAEDLEHTARQRMHDRESQVASQIISTRTALLVRVSFSASSILPCTLRASAVPTEPKAIIQRIKESIHLSLESGVRVHKFFRFTMEDANRSKKRSSRYKKSQNILMFNTWLCTDNIRRIFA